MPTTPSSTPSELDWGHLVGAQWWSLTGVARQGGAGFHDAEDAVADAFEELYVGKLGTSRELGPFLVGVTRKRVLRQREDHMVEGRNVWEHLNLVSFPPDGLVSRDRCRTANVRSRTLSAVPIGPAQGNILPRVACPVCGTLFSPHLKTDRAGRHRRQTTCGRACMSIKQTAVRPPPRPCPVCGKQFSPYSPKAHYEKKTCGSPKCVARYGVLTRKPKAA